jgi:hypothetical protein
MEIMVVVVAVLVPWVVLWAIAGIAGRTSATVAPRAIRNRMGIGNRRLIREFPPPIG